MSDLISRNYIREYILRHPMADIHEILDAVYDAPVAYDVDKVVEQLECLYKIDCFPCADTIPCNKCLNKKAIAIIKAGGVNE